MRSMINKLVSSHYTKRSKTISFVFNEEKTMKGRRNSRNNSYVDNLRRRFSDREMYKATCAKWGKECKVPFEPAKGRSVYCRECFIKRRR